MRRSMLVAAVLAVAVSVGADDTKVTLMRPEMNFLTRAQVQNACRQNHPVHGCTTMEATLLTSCRATSADRFYISSAVHLKPVMYVASQSIVSHELRHVSDVLASLKKYTRDMAATLYDTVDACEISAEIARLTFGQRMQMFQHESAVRQDRHDPQRLADTQITRADRGD